MSQTIQLFTTAGCHLCEQAEAMVLYLIENEDTIGSRFKLQEVEIASNDALLEQYGVRIPVLAVNSRELGWPFDLDELTRWLD